MKTFARTLAVTAFSLALTVSALAQDATESDEDERHRVLRDQTRMSARLVSLHEKMQRLSERYEDEGRAHNAQLLRDAIARFESDGLLNQALDIEQSLSRSMLDTVEKQDGLTGSLESIYAVLSDRRDVDDVRDKVNLANEAIAELGNLIVDQERLLSQTRAASDNPSELVESAMEVAQQLDQALADAEKAAARAEAVEAGFAEVALAEQLAAAQRALERSSSASAERQRAVADGTDELLRLLSEPLQDAGSPEAMARVEQLRAEARRSAASARAAMKRAEAQLRAAESEADAADSGEAGEGAPGSEAPTGEPGQPSSDGRDGSEAPSGSSAEPSAESGAAGESGQPSEAGTSGEAGQPGESGEAGQPGESGESGEAGQTGAPAEATPGASAQPSNAGSNEPGEQIGDKPSEQTDVGEPSAVSEEAADQMAQAAEQLEQARDSLREAERQLAAARNRAMASARLESREAKSESAELDDIAQRLETLQPEEGPELLDRTRELLDEIAALNQKLESGDSSGAQQSASQARMDLNQLLKQLQQRAQSAGEADPEPLSSEQVAQMVEDQQQLEKQLRQLMDRLEEMPDQSFRESGDQAASAMDQAAESMESGDAGEASVRQEEAVEELEEAKKELEGERNRYERLRQEEVLYQLAEELTRLRDAQVAISDELLEIDELRGDEQRLSRSHRRALARLASEERELSRQTDDLKVALEEDSAVAFVFTIEQTRDDMNDVADRLADRETGYVIQSMIDGIEQRIDDLLAVLEAEKERRREAMENQEGEEPPPEQDGQGKPSLVPEVAELLLIQRLELSALSKLETFQRLHPELNEEGGLGPMERGLLERWALEHMRITEVFLSMIPESPEIEMPMDEAHGGDDGLDVRPVAPDDAAPDDESPEENK